ncbi:MAG: CHASE domain-containing protein [Armatimonadota bacterium]
MSFPQDRALLQTPQSALQKGHSAWIVLVVGLMVTAAATLYMKSSVENLAEHEFISQCNVIQTSIADRLDDHSRILLSGAALFGASDSVNRNEWRIFTKHQKFEKTLPGIQGIGFSLLIPRADLSRHIQQIRSEGFPNYNVRPVGDRDLYSSIIYLEPFSGRNLRAFGYDMFSESVRRSAMERARDTDTPALSGKVVLVQETKEAVQAGTLMYVPVYRKGMPINTVAQRRAALYGWVYSPYRMTDLMQGILSGFSSEKQEGIHLQAFDGMRASPQSLLFELHPETDQTRWPEVRFTRQSHVDFKGRHWALRFTDTCSGFSTVGYIRAWLTLFGGIVITFLLFSLIRALHNTRAKALIAENLTAELQETQAILQAALDNSAAGIAIADAPDGVLRYVNDAGLLIRGGEREHIVDGVGIDQYVSTWQLLDLDGRPLEPEEVPLAHSILFGETCGREFIIRRDISDDRIVLANASPIRNAGGDVIAAIVVFMDITERKQIEEALRDSEARFKTMFNAAPLGIALVDSLTGKVYSANPMFAKIVGIPTEGLDHIDWINITPPEGVLPDLDNAAQLSADNKSQYQIEQHYIHPDGKPVWTNMTIATIFTEDIAQPLHLCMLEDITGRKTAEMEITQLNSDLERRVRERTSQLEAANKELETFCYSVAHDLRAPLRHIDGYVGMLVSRCREHLPDQGLHYLDTIVDASRQMGVLIDDLLQFSRTGRADMRLENLDMNQVLLDALNSLKESHRDRTIEWVISDLPCVRGDYGLLRQVWANLLGNAVKYTEPKETVRIEVGCRKEKDEIIFTVKDNGVGFDMQYAGKLFGIFQRLHPQEEFEGVGIGLATVQRIIERHGGRVWAEAELDHGATFYFTLPRPMEKKRA